MISSVELQRKPGVESNLVVTQVSSVMEQICAWSSSENTNTDLNFKHDNTVKQPQLWPKLVSIPERAIINQFHANVYSMQGEFHSPFFVPTRIHIHVWVYFCLLQIGCSQIFLVSPDTKKVAIEKSFREISFCSQVCSVLLMLSCN